MAYKFLGLSKSKWMWIEFGGITLSFLVALVFAIWWAENRSCAISAAVATFFIGAARLSSKKCEDEDKKQKESTEAKNKSDYEKKAKQIVLKFLNYLKDGFFRSDSDYHHSHRVTIFKCMVDEQGIFLGVFARSGLRPESTTVWRLNAENVSCCEGLAGQVWFNQTTDFIQSNIPCPVNPTDNDIALYASSQKLDHEKAKSLGHRFQYVWGAPIMVRGKSWGVLLVDSNSDWRHDTKSGSLKKQESKLKQYVETVSAMLEELE